MANNTTVFTPEETLVILETARRALSDADIFDELAGDHDIADDQLKALQEKLQAAMDENCRDEIQLDTRESGEALELDGECANDYRFTDKTVNIWITVEGVSIQVARHRYEDGDSVVVAEMFRLGEEDSPIAECCTAL